MTSSATLNQDPHTVATQARKIFFLTPHYERVVHAGCLGLTRSTLIYGWGDTRQDAEDTVRAHMMGAYQLQVQRFSPSPTEATEHTLSKMAFPEQVIGAPESAVMAALRLQHLPKHLVDNAWLKHAGLMRTVERGRKLLAASNAPSPASTAA